MKTMTEATILALFILGILYGIPMIACVVSGSGCEW